MLKVISLIKIRIDGDSSETAPAPSKETTNTSETSSINYNNICYSDYLNIIAVGDSNG